MTDVELRELVASLAVSQKETDRQLKETDKQLKETDKQLKETDRQLREADKRLERKLDRLSELVGGISNNNAHFAEDIFISNDKLRNLVDSLAVSQKETDRQLKETDKQLKETDKQLKETDRQLRETDQRLERKLDRLSELVGGISNNNGHFAEDIFIAALEKNPHIGAIRFDFVDSHFKGKSKKGFEYEYDIFLQNGAYIGLVEVKYRLHPESVRKFATEALPKFREIFPQFADKKIIGAVASTSIPKVSIDEAISHGLAVLSQEGQEIRVLSDKLQEY